jgi:hypothetical protein
MGGLRWWRVVVSAVEVFLVIGGSATILTIMGAVFGLGLKLGGMRVQLDEHSAKIDAVILANSKTLEALAPLVMTMTGLEKGFERFTDHYFPSDYPRRLDDLRSAVSGLTAAIHAASTLQAVRDAAAGAGASAPAH